MNIKNLILSLIVLTVMIGCQESKQEIFDISVSWELITNQAEGENKFRSVFTLENKGTVALNETNWKMYYSQSPRRVVDGSVTSKSVIEQIGGDFYVLKPSTGFVLNTGEKIDIQYEGSDFLLKHADAPIGVYFIFGDDQKTKFTPKYAFVPFRPEQVTKGEGDFRLVPSAQLFYDENEKILNSKSEQISKIVPTPVYESFTSETIQLDVSWNIGIVEGLQSEAEFLSNSLSEIMGSSPVAKVGDGKILLILDNSLKEAEGYVLTITQDQITIKGKDKDGVFYGIQSLLALIPIESFDEGAAKVDLPIGKIMDAPRYGYRGMHLDAARNFQSMASVKKLIDIMAFYKLNKLHLHLTDDEGWRLESKILPELTEVGSNRAHTDNEKGGIRPAYGSGVDGRVSGKGFYSQEEYIEILQYADKRHIEVIPELNMPGHARAAITAMNARYDRLIAEGDEKGALEYFLIDTQDASEYFSAQHYDDNVVCVCNEAVYRFYETVVDEVIAMHKTAGVPLKWLHTGGDEVPRGVWEKSPDCAEFLAMSDDYNSAKSLQTYFISRVNKILTERGLATAGWEEVAMTINEDGSWYPNTNFSDKNMIPYVWNSMWGNQDLGYKLANGGFPIVLCNATNLYFDLAYNKDPREPGLYWGGLVNTRTAWEFLPEDIYKSTKMDASGNLFDRDNDFRNMPRLTKEGRANVLGIQGQLWSETINQGPKMLEYYYLPKIFGLAERAWATKPKWAAIADHSTRQLAEDVAWSEFAARMGSRELPRLNYIFNGFNYRVMPPGGKIEGGKLFANHLFERMEIRYTSDGTEPKLTSTLYESPVEVSGTILLKAFDREGNSSLSISF